MYVRQPGSATQVAEAIRPAYVLSSHKFFIDELYDYFLVKPLVGFAQFLRVIDQYVVDGLVDITGNIPRLLGRFSGRSRTAWCSIRAADDFGPDGFPFGPYPLPVGSP